MFANLIVDKTKRELKIIMTKDIDYEWEKKHLIGKMYILIDL